MSKNNFRHILSWVFIVVAVAINPWSLSYFFSPDRAIDFWSQYFIIFGFELGLLFFAFLIYLDKLKEILILLIAISFSLVLGEVLSGYVYKIIVTNEPNPVLYDENLEWFVNPEFKPESYGFNDKPFIFENLEEDNLIYAIGDSFTYGSDWDRSYMALLDDYFLKYNIINLGVPGHDPWQYEIMVKRYSAIKQPKKIFLNYYVGNDFSKPKFINQSRLAAARNFFVTINASEIPFNSYLLRNLKLFYHQLLSWEDRIRSGNFLSSEELLLQAGKEVISFAKKEYSAEDQASIDISFQHLKNIIDYTRLNDIELIVFIIPDFYQVEEQSFQNICDFNNLNPADYDIYKPQRTVVDFLAQLDIPYIDFLSEFKQLGVTEVLYKPNDGHFNSRGNELAAQLIAAKLKDLKLLD